MSSPDPSDNQKNVLICIKTQFQKGKSGGDTFEAYKSFCRFLGDDVMEYNEFDFWWYRFKEGNFDLDYDRSKDPKKPGLSDIPSDLIEEIVGELGWIDTRPLRKVSKKFNEIVEGLSHTFKKVELWDMDAEIGLKMDGDLIIYEHLGGIQTRLRVGENARTVPIRPHWACATDDFHLILKNPNNTFEKLSIYIDRKLLIDRLSHILKSLNHQIHVKCIKFVSDYEGLNGSVKCVDFERRLMQILPYLKPGVLECIKIKPLAESWKNRRLDEVVRLEQWKQAKRLKSDLSLPIEYTDTFENIEIGFEKKSAKELIRLREILSKNPNFESCRVNTWSDFGDVLQQKLKRSGFQMNDGNIQVEMGNGFVDFKKI